LHKKNGRESLEVSKKIEKPIKSRKSEKKSSKKSNCEKNRLEFLKNQPVRFSFGLISMTLKKSNRTEQKKQVKLEKTDPNRFLF